MKTTEQKVPALRFPEFEGEWEEKKLGEVLTIFNGYAFSSSDATTNGTSWVKIANVGIQEMRNDDLSYLPSTFKEDYSKFLLKEGDYIIALTRPILNGKLKVAEVSAFFNNSLLNQRVGKIVSNESQPFIYCLLQLNKVIHEIENNIAGTDPPNLSPKDIDSIKFSFPSLPEQQKIADFLSATDKRLELLKEKKQGLEDYKRGAMQGIFSQELRFTRPDGSAYEDWEEKKLGEIFTFRQGVQCPVESQFLSKENNTVRFIRIIDITSNGNEPPRFIIPSKIEDILQEKDIFMVRYGTPGVVGIGYNGIIANNLFRLIPKKNIDTLFFYYLLYFNYTKFVAIASSSTMPALNFTSIANLNFIYATSVEEQTQIANFLSAIDIKIEKLSEQIEATENYKKGLLQQMFV